MPREVSEFQFSFDIISTAELFFSMPVEDPLFV